MTLDQFTEKWLGKRVDRDGVYAYQCVDLILQYLAEVHGITSGVTGNAIDYWTKPSARLLQDFEKVSKAPQAGDIVILKPTSPTGIGQYGHILIAINDTTAIEQNGATGDGDGLGGDEIRYRTIPLARVAGLLRKKGNNMIGKDDVAPVRIVMSEVEGWNGHNIHSGKDDGVIMGAWQGHSWPEFIYHCWTVQGLHRQQLTDNVASLTAQANDLTTKFNSSTARIDELSKVIAIKDNAITDQVKQIESLKSQVGDNSKWETLKALIRELVKG